MLQNETKAKRDVGKRNSSTKSIHERPKSFRSRLESSPSCTSPRTPTREEESSLRRKRRDFDKVAGDKTSPLDVYLRFKLSASSNLDFTESLRYTGFLFTRSRVAFSVQLVFAFHRR